MSLYEHKFPLKAVSTRKWCAKHIDPFHVLQHVGVVAYKLELPQTFKTHNVLQVSLLKAWHSRGTCQAPSSSLMVEGGEECMIAKQSRPYVMR